MSNNITAINIIISKALEEAGIDEAKAYKVDILSQENDLLEFVAETEWNITECYADLESTMILGLMTTPKTIEELMGSTQRTSCRAYDRRKTA